MKNNGIKDPAVVKLISELSQLHDDCDGYLRTIARELNIKLPSCCDREEWLACITNRIKELRRRAWT